MTRLLKDNWKIRCGWRFSCALRCLSLVVDSSGPPLATMGGVPYRVRSARLSPGDTIFLYTDGVTEAMNLSGELWGESRFEQDFASRSCDARGYCEQTIAAIDDFAGEAPQADDITSLVVTVKAVG